MLNERETAFMPPIYNKVAIVGVGLLGGSIGLAIQTRRLADLVVGVGRRQASLEVALRSGVVQQISTDLKEGVAGAGLVIVCTPVDLIAGYVASIAEVCAEGAVITDVGSTKQQIVESIAPLPRGVAFVGSHPMAGSDKTGAANALPHLFMGRRTIVTPGEDTPAAAVDAIKQFWRQLGSCVTVMSPAEHDRAVAVVSHVPHVVSAALAEFTPAELLPVAATGWASTTRIAGGDASLWRKILLENRVHVLQALEAYGKTLESHHAAIAAGDAAAVESLLNQGRATRQRKKHDMLWEVDVYPASGQPDLTATMVSSEAEAAGLPAGACVAAARGYLIQGGVSPENAADLSTMLLADTVVERTITAPVGDALLSQAPPNGARVLHVLPKPGVTDPVAESALRALHDLGIQAEAVVTLRKYWVSGDLDDATVDALSRKILSNDSIEQVIAGPLQMDKLQLGRKYDFELIRVPLLAANDEQMMQISRDGLLSLTLIEMQTIQQHFRELGRDPTDIELESVAQTWSEHCSHKTLAGRVNYQDENGPRQFNNMLKETIFAATQQIRKDLGDSDWCVSVFKDNAGIVKFDADYNVAFKVETHNRPSALEPYGGANTGIGGVIRDTLGTGRGAHPVCSTDVFCFASPETPLEDLPPGVLHPRRVMKGVVAGVRDYGNRMGIPTVNGAVYFDQRYLGNPLVFCGNVGVLPKSESFKEVQAGDYIVSIGGRTGRDGIHGATFSSVELTSESDVTSGGAVQIGNAITEKMVADVLIAARDRGLYTAVTDCGAGGFSSAIGEMGEEIGAEVWLDKAPLKYDGLTYTEIWISEAQERMVFSVPPQHWEEFSALCAAEDVEAVILGKFEPTGNLTLKYHDETVGEISMAFLHDGRPPVVRDATYTPQQPVAFKAPAMCDFNLSLMRILRSLNVASKEWIIRQYDHEVQGGSVVKPLTGASNDGPSDASVVRPLLNSRRGLVIGCGMNPYYGDHDPYHMAASSIDEAMRNVVATGADPGLVALLDNFCWGYTDRPETLGSLVRAAIACHDAAIALSTPFISGKDSLNNEFSYGSGEDRKTISIPSTLLISAMGQINDVARAVTMDLKSAGNVLVQVGATHNEMGGSHFSLVEKKPGGEAPKVDFALSRRTFETLHQAMQNGQVRACHDLSEGGLATALAEMAFAGGLGVEVPELTASPHQGELNTAALLFAESNTRFICEVKPEHQDAFLQAFKQADVPAAVIGSVTEKPEVHISANGEKLIDTPNAALKKVWQEPLAKL